MHGYSGKRIKLELTLQHNGEPSSEFCILDTSVCCSQLQVHDVYHICCYIPFYISVKKVIIVVSADSIYFQFIDQM